MSRVDDLLRDTLSGRTQPASNDGWNQVARRGDELIRRRRVRRASIASAVVIATIVVGVAFFQRDSGEKSGSIATNPAQTSSTIVASVNGGVVTLDPADGHVISHVVDGRSRDAGNSAAGVAATPDGTTLYYTKPSPNRSCGANVIVEHTMASGAEHDLVCGTSPIVSPDGQWIAYTNADGNFAGDFLAITSLSTRQNYRPYEQLLGAEPSKVKPLAWSRGDHLLWNRFHLSSSSDQQTYQLNNPPLDHGNQPTPSAALQLVSAATYTADGRLVVARGTTDGWNVNVLNDDGTIASTRFQATGPMPSALAAAPDTDTILLTMPDGRLLIQDGTATPRTLTTGIQSAAWLTMPRAAPATTTTSTTVAAPTSTTVAAPLDIAAAKPTFDEQVKQLETWYHNWPAEAPGGRPVIAAEWTYCDYTNNTDASAGPHIGVNLPAVQPGFSSYSRLSEPLTEARIVDGCFYRADRFPGDTPANVPVETAADQLPPYVFCATDQPGPNYDPGSARLDATVKPAVVFGGTDCTAAGYQDPPPDFIADLDRRRHIEIELRAVPKSCPTGDDAARWAQHVVQQELGQTWQVDGTGSSATCTRPAYIDWENHHIGMMLFKL